MGEDKDHDLDARTQAADWFARLKSVPVSRDTLDQFFAWRKIGDHGEAFAEVERFWSNAAAAADQPAIVRATQAAYERGKQRDGKKRGRVFIPALAVLLAAAGGIGWISLRPTGEHYATRVGEQSAVTLRDGSKMTLDTDTQVVVWFEKNGRHVSLDHGQAYFAVAHDTARPFTVSADGTSVLATGTQFDVRRIGRSTDVILVEGKVSVTAPGGGAPVRLNSGEQFRLRADHAAVVRAVDTGSATSWRSGHIILDGMTLRDAIAEVNRYTTAPIRLDANRYADKRFSGSFEVGDVTSFVQAATALLPLKAVPTADGGTILTEMDQKPPGA